MMQSDTIKALEINLPLPPEVSDGGVLDIYTRFMSHLRCVPTSRMEIKVLAAIQLPVQLFQLHGETAYMAAGLGQFGLQLVVARRQFPAQPLGDELPAQQADDKADGHTGYRGDAGGDKHVLIQFHSHIRSGRCQCKSKWPSGGGLQDCGWDCP